MLRTVLALLLLAVSGARAAAPAAFTPGAPTQAPPAAAMVFAAQDPAIPALVGSQPNVDTLEFTADPRIGPSFGFSARRWWARLRLNTAAPAPWYIRVDAPSADILEAYARCGSAAWVALPRIRARYATFRADLAPQGCDIALRQESRAVIRFSTTLLSADALPHADDETLIGLTFGISTAIAVMAAFLWRTTRQPELPPFILYQCATVITILRIWGFVPGMTLAQPAWLGGLMGIAGLNLWVVGFFRYVCISLRLAHSHPRLDRALHALTLSAVIAIAGQAAGLRYQWPLTAFNMAIGLSCWMLVVSLCWHGQRARALAQVIGYSPTVLCFVIYMASLAGRAQLADLRLLYLLGHIGTTLALGLWMARGFAADRDRREQALATTVAELEQNRGELERYQTDLEAMVGARTTELQRALETERAMVAQQRDFTAMIGHEFRTPLAVIDGQARRIEKTGDSADLLRRSHEIRDAVRDMLSLMDGLLFHVRSESGSAEFRFASIRAADLLKRAIDTAVPRHRLTDLRLNLPEAEIFCRADLPLLATALGNILANAAKYSADGTPIELALSARDEQIQITVADHGIGIPPAEIGTIFARFQRATNALSHVGAGLGLHVAQQVVEGHGGAITVRSQPGNGSCFTINLPLLRLASAAAPQLEIGTA